MAEDYASVDTPACVIDSGSASTKVGFAGDSEPERVFPSMVGRLKDPGLCVTVPGYKEAYIGEEASTYQRMMHCNWPMQKRCITDWADMERLWQHTVLNELRVEPEEQAILLIDAPLTPKADRQRTAEIMFETIKAPALCFSMAALLSMYAAGSMTGVAIDSGAGITHSVAVHEGQVVPGSIQAMAAGGDDVAAYLRELLGKRDPPSPMVSEQVVEKMKKELTRVKCSSEEEPPCEGTNATFELPDGESLSIDKERFQCTEVLFNVEVMNRGLKGPKGFHIAVAESIGKCEKALHRELYGEIVLSGGNTMFPGIAKRFTKELMPLAPSGVKLKITASPNRQYFPWIGGSVLAALSTFPQLCVSKAEYEENGPTLVDKKCPSMLA